MAADSGEALYKTKCAACHGPDGTGSTAAGKKLGTHDFHSPEVLKESEAEMTRIVKDGKNKMPAYKEKLTDDQIKSLVTYVRELSKKTP
jgi:mono/diheme cytochrome c family protein